MERDRASPRPEPLGNRSNIRRPITAKGAQPLPDTLETGRTTLAAIGNQPRFLQQTVTASQRRTSDISQRSVLEGSQQKSMVRRSSSTTRDNTELIKYMSKNLELQNELEKMKEELDNAKVNL
ncbi:hypothetical protein DICVIV_14314 [Dictyocaulus viviparus]|uniref:Uncharacterized protein n=1 Tax=Dictyocaulus viviparus TaxID=29172 RepID=A0A0D8X7P3_DICVI|nr:hypothetical protein DICVIV_14314 [Dictyocaulus viviparus]